MYRYGLYRYGLYSYGLHSYGLYSYGLNSYGLYSYGSVGHLPLDSDGAQPTLLCTDAKIRHTGLSLSGCRRGAEDAENFSEHTDGERRGPASNFSVPKDVSHRDLSDATLRCDLAHRHSPSACAEKLLRIDQV